MTSTNRWPASCDRSKKAVRAVWAAAAVVRHLKVLESAATRVAENYVIGADLAGFLVLTNIPHYGDGCRADAVYSV